DAVSGADAWRPHWSIPLAISLAGCALRDDDAGAAGPGAYCRRRLYDHLFGLARHPTRHAPGTTQCARCDPALSPPRARLKRLCAYRLYLPGFLECRLDLTRDAHALSGHESL